MAAQLLEQLRIEDAELAAQLDSVRPTPSRARPGAGRKASPMGDEEKAEVRRMRAKIAYKKRQLAKAGAEVPVREPRPKAPAKRAAPAKKSAPVPVPPGRSGPQMVFVPAKGVEMPKADEEDYIEEEDDGDSGFDPSS